MELLELIFNIYLFLKGILGATWAKIFTFFLIIAFIYAAFIVFSSFKKIPHLIQSLFQFGDKNKVRRKQYSQFEDYIQGLHLSIDHNKSSISKGYITDSIARRIVAEFHYVSAKKSNTPQGIYHIEFNDSFFSVAPIDFVIFNEAENASKITTKKTEGSNQIGLEPFLCPEKNLVIERSNYSLDVEKLLVEKSPPFVLDFKKLAPNKANNMFDFSVKFNDQAEIEVLDSRSPIKSNLQLELIELSGRGAKRTSHKYLHGNGVVAHDGLVISKKTKTIKPDYLDESAYNYNDYILNISRGDLIIPIQNIHGDIMNYQVIFMNQVKRFRIAVSLKGGFFVVGSLGDYQDYVLCEDYLSAATIHRITGKTVLVCFDIQNMYCVAKDITDRYKGANLIFAASKDLDSKRSPRVKKALFYAKEFNSLFVFPKFPNEKKYTQYKTWNELQRFLSDDQMLGLFNSQLSFCEEVGVSEAVARVSFKFGLEGN